MGKYIAGNPAIVVQNEPGASSLTAANNLYNVAPRDGTVIGMISRTLPIMSLVDRGESNIRFDVAKFNWIGTMSNGSGDAFVLLVRDDVDVHSVGARLCAGASRLRRQNNSPAYYRPC